MSISSTTSLTPKRALNVLRPLRTNRSIFFGGSSVKVLSNTKVHFCNAIAIKILCLATILAITPLLSAQSFYGSVVGTVTDASGAVVPGATITVTNIGTSESVKVKTDSGGKYSAVNLLPAEYMGYFVGAIATAGLAGVNIWHKGPLDPNDDPGKEGSGDASQPAT